MKTLLDSMSISRLDDEKAKRERTALKTVRSLNFFA